MKSVLISKSQIVKMLAVSHLMIESDADDVMSQEIELQVQFSCLEEFTW